MLDAHTWTGTQWANCDGQIEKGGRRLDCRYQPETVDSEQDEDGCPEFLITARGRGFEAPTADDTPEGRRANHRVEVVADLSGTTPSRPLCP